jgi:transposase
MGKKVESVRESRRGRRSFTPTVKAEVVALVRQGDRSLPAICREMDLSETAVRHWVAQAAVDAGEAAGLTTEEREELCRLRREVRVLREERDILKRAATFFAMETRAGTGSSRWRVDGFRWCVCAGACRSPAPPIMPGRSSPCPRGRTRTPR